LAICEHTLTDVQNPEPNGAECGYSNISPPGHAFFEISSEFNDIERQPSNTYRCNFIVGPDGLSGQGAWRSIPNGHHYDTAQFWITPDGSLYASQRDSFNPTAQKKTRIADHDGSLTKSLTAVAKKTLNRTSQLTADPHSQQTCTEAANLLQTLDQNKP